VFVKKMVAARKAVISLGNVKAVASDKAKID